MEVLHTHHGGDGRRSRSSNGTGKDPRSLPRISIPLQEEPSHLTFGEATLNFWRPLPSNGPLFPYLASVRECDRATEFRQRCQGLNIQGITLHNYRYAWSERAKKAGYPERFAHPALGLSSKAVALCVPNLDGSIRLGTAKVQAVVGPFRWASRQGEFNLISQIGSKTSLRRMPLWKSNRLD